MNSGKSEMITMRAVDPSEKIVLQNLADKHNISISFQKKGFKLQNKQAAADSFVEITEQSS